MHRTWLLLTVAGLTLANSGCETAGPPLTVHGSLEQVQVTHLRPDAEVIVSRYAFVAYKIVATLFGARAIETPSPTYGHDLEAMLAAITPKTRLIFIANPNNPTGTLLDPRKIDNFMSRVPEDVVVGIDEACTGVRSLQATLMVSLFLGEFYNFNFLRRVILIASGAALAFVCNLVRTFLLVWLGAEHGSHTIERWHDPAGYSILTACLLGLWALSLFLGKNRETPPSRSPAGASPYREY